MNNTNALIKSSPNNNTFCVLDSDDSDDSDNSDDLDNSNIKSKPNKKKIISEFIDPKIITISKQKSVMKYPLKILKRPTNSIGLIGINSLTKINSLTSDNELKNSSSQKSAQISFQTFSKHNYNVLDEIKNLPKNLDEAIIKKQNLTLKQIIILMNLHALAFIGLDVLNIIHDNLQFREKIKKFTIKIFHGKKIFFVSLYKWYDLKKIVGLIEKMLFYY